jgi:hypothetical protein
MNVSGKIHAPVALSPGRAPGTHLMGGWLGPTAGLDAMAKRKIPVPAWNRTTVIYPLA